MEAIEAARRMVRERGYVVIAILPAFAYRPGDRTPHFGGAALQEGAQLQIDSATDREDYAVQAVALFGSTEPIDKEPPVEIGGYWRCSLVEAPRG